MVLCRWAQRKPLRDVAGIERLQRHVTELFGYLERNREALVHYAARRRRGEPILTYPLIFIKLFQRPRPLKR